MHSENTYALIVKGDAMLRNSGKSYPDGAIIFVDVAAVKQIKSGDPVIAMLNSKKQLVFKTYMEDAGRQFLKSLNNQYPPIKESFRIVGKVIGMWLQE